MSWSEADTIQPTSPTPAVQHWTEQVSGGTLHGLIVFGVGGAVVGTAITVVPSAITAGQTQTPLTTVGAGTLLAAALLSGDILRTGPTGAFTDTTDTAANIQTAWLGAGVGSSFQTTYQNNTAFAATLAAGSGVTLSGNTIVSANQFARILFVWTGAGTVTGYVIYQGQSSPLPDAQYNTSAVTVGTIAAGLLTGSKFNVWQNTGNTPGTQTVRTAAQLLADTPNGKVGNSSIVRIINTGTGTLTVTADGGATVTLTGTMTVLTNTWRDFILTFNTATTATLQTIGTGVAP